MGRGLFLVLEGADGVGTTTQAAALVNALNGLGLRAHGTAEPSRGPIGKLAREMLRGDQPRASIHRELALLFAADRLDHLGREVEPLLAEGVHVVSDRYLLSSLVYQGLDLPLSWVEAINRHARPPDATLLLELPVHTAMTRLRARGGDKEIFDDPETQLRVHERYADLADRVNGIRVDGAGTVVEVTARLVAALRTADAWPL
jgi:dTMP kinase